MESLYPDSRQTEADWKGKYRIDGRSLTVFLKESDLEKAKRYLEEMSSMDEGMEKEVDLDAMPLPGFSGTDLDPWIYFHLEHDWLGTYLRCELYDSWNGGECDSINCTGGPRELLGWQAELPPGSPVSKVTFELAEEGMEFCHLANPRPAPARLSSDVRNVQERESSLYDTPMTWYIRAEILSLSEKRFVKQDLMEEMEKSKDTILALYPGEAVGSSLEECLDGTIKASVFTESFKLLFAAESDHGMWKRTLHYLFRGTVDEVKKKLADMTEDAVSHSGAPYALLPAGSVPKVEKDPYGLYVSRAEFGGGRRVVFSAGLFDKDWSRYRVFDLGDMVKGTAKEHPGLPLVLLHDGKVIEDKQISCAVSEFLDYDYFNDKRAVTSREQLKLLLTRHFEKEYKGKPEKIRKARRDALEEMEPYWIKAMLIKAD